MPLLLCFRHAFVPTAWREVEEKYCRFSYRKSRLARIGGVLGDMFGAIVYLWPSSAIVTENAFCTRFRRSYTYIRLGNYEGSTSISRVFENSF